MCYTEMAELYTPISIMKSKKKGIISVGGRGIPGSKQRRSVLTPARHCVYMVAFSL